MEALFFPAQCQHSSSRMGSLLHYFDFCSFFFGKKAIINAKLSTEGKLGTSSEVLFEEFQKEQAVIWLAQFVSGVYSSNLPQKFIQRKSIKQIEEVPD